MAESRVPYQVVARRFRPRAFDEVVGQQAVLTSLRSALMSGRIPHAFLFAGSRGVGKTTLARILARALNCERGPTVDPCGTCGACRSILDGSNPDVVEIDAASHNLVEDVRELRDRVGFASMGSRFKIYILDEVHMLSKSAFNAFLKTLEEPPQNVVFVLATTELHRVPDTIRSRCQVLLFRRVGEREIAERLRAICAKEGVPVGPEILAEVARSSRGGMRDAETALERLLPLAREQQESFDLAAYRQVVDRIGLAAVLELTGALLRGDARAGLRFADEVCNAGADEREALGDLLEVLRALLVLRVDGPDSELLGALAPQRNELRQLAALADVDRLDAMLQAVIRGREAIRRVEDRRVLLEVTLLRVAQAGQLPTLAELAAACAAAPAVPAALPLQAPPAAPAGEGFRALLLERARQEQPTLVSTLELCRIEGPDAQGPDAADQVTLRLATDKKLHQDRLANPAVQEQLAKLAGQAAGRPVRLRIEASGTAPAAAAAAKPQPGPATRNVIERFDGRLLESEET